LLLYLFEEVVIRVPGLRQVLHIVASLFDQRPPDMVGTSRQRIRGAVEAALLRHAVVAVGRIQRGFAVLGFLRLHNIADVDQLVVPGVQRDDLARVVGEHVRHYAGLYRRDDLLAQRGIGGNRELDRVAACLLIVGDDLLDGNVFFFGEALGPPDRRGG